MPNRDAQQKIEKEETEKLQIWQDRYFKVLVNGESYVIQTEILGLEHKELMIRFAPTLAFQTQGTRATAIDLMDSEDILNRVLEQLASQFIIQNGEKASVEQAEEISKDQAFGFEEV